MTWGDQMCRIGLHTCFKPFPESSCSFLLSYGPDSAEQPPARQSNMWTLPLER